MNLLRVIKNKIKQQLIKRLHLPNHDILPAIEQLVSKEPQNLADSVIEILEKKSAQLPPFEALKFQFEIENRLYQLQGQASVRYGNGEHSKHRHIKYHDFFVQNIDENTSILDVGCGIGALAFDIAIKVKQSKVYAIDIEQNNISNAIQKYSASNIEYVCGDALIDLPDKKFDVIVLSNVLEHIEKRIDFLKTLNDKYSPRKFLIRVPLFERDWRVPLKREIGIDYRLDSTHFIEYLQEEFFEEIKQAGLQVNHYQIKWGEIWAEIISQ